MKSGSHVTEIFAVLTLNPVDNIERIQSVLTFNGDVMPMVEVSADGVAALRVLALTIKSEAPDTKMRLVRFSKMEVVEVFE
jgi:hypothetical protein